MATIIVEDYASPKKTEVFGSHETSVYVTWVNLRGNKKW